MLAIVAGTTLVGYMTYTASFEIEAKLGARYHHLAVLTVPFVAFGILRYLYLVDRQNEGGDPARLLLQDRPLLIGERLPGIVHLVALRVGLVAVPLAFHPNICDEMAT